VAMVNHQRTSWATNQSPEAPSSPQDCLIAQAILCHPLHSGLFMKKLEMRRR
jgi:hypothetical protein